MKIIIIKLGAKGDVIRTLPIAKALKEEYPNSKIYWITKENVKSLLTNISYIDRLFVLPFNTHEEFDVLYNFDIEDEATSIASQAKAKKKYGFYKNENYISAFNLGGEYYLNTLFDDEIKKTNKKTYQEMMFEAAELNYKREFVPLVLKKEDLEYAINFIKENKINTEKLIGIHMGASPRWPSKIWHEDNLKEFIIGAKNKGYEILLFAGPDEVERQKKFIEGLKEGNVLVCKNEPNNTDRQFASLINICKVVVCSDSFALHVSLALKKPTIGLFFCTSPNEVEDYGFLKKIVSPILYEFFPEKMDEYNEELTKSIKAEEVLSVLEEINY